MGISLLRISLLQFFNKFLKFALCVVLIRIFGYFISLVQFFVLYLANANFFPEPKVALGKNSL